MSTYKLTYYNAKGLAEPIRFLLSYGKIEYEDIRVPFEFTGKPPVLDQEIKDKCPWGQVPVLEFDGKCLAQSLAITRYLAKKVKLAGSDDFESAKCDEYVDTIKDFSKDFGPIYMENDPVKKADLLKSVSQNLSEKYFGKFEAIVGANEVKYLVGKNLTWADLLFAHTLSQVSAKFEHDFLAGFPNLKAVVANVFEVPEIKAWVDKRPTTEY